MNKSNYGLLFFIIIIFSFVFSNNALSWDGNTHKQLSEYGADSSVLSMAKGDYLKGIGFIKGINTKLKWGSEKTVKEWLAVGAELEDAGNLWQLATKQSRSYNHFHNPVKQFPWTDAGLDDWIFLPPFHTTGQSSILWAQDGVNQENFPERNWSWQKVRDYYYLALTLSADSVRQENFAKTFRGLGHQMHLVQDTSVPDHVRNDAHPEDAMFGNSPVYGSAYFESWAKEKEIFIRCLLEKHSYLPPDILSKCQQYGIDESVNLDDYFPAVSFNISYNGLSPTTQLFDAEEYNGSNPSISLTQGLSEYTNANFFSEDTIFAAERYSADNGHYFPYPKSTSTDLQNYLAGTKPEETVVAEDGDTDTGIWISKNADGENVEHFVRTGKLTKWFYNIFGEGELFYKTFYRDDKCHEDYAQNLIPRAVGYSAGLLNYFFRGTLEITAPDSYVYSITDGSINPQQFTKIKAKVMNTTPNEEIKNGILQAVARYKIIPNYSPDLSNYPPDGDAMKVVGYSYSVSEQRTLTSEEITSLNTQPTEFTFDFTKNPIPAGITDLYLQVIFKGTLGNEADNAIAAGMKDLKEPTHHVFWNLTDMFSLLYEKDGVNKYHLHISAQIKADPYLASLVDLNHNGIFNEDNEPYIDPYPITYEITYMVESSPIEPVYTSASVGDLPAGRYIRLIVLVDDEQMDNYGRLAWSETIDYEIGAYDFTFEGVTNQEEGSIWQPPTPIITFRDVRQYFYTGILNCYPVAVDPATGVHYCPYPEEEAIPADPTPYPVTILFP